MSRRKVVIGCAISLAVAVGAALTVSDPAFRVREGMTYGEVEGMLGKQLRGLRPVSMVDGSWTGLWPGRWGFVEVTFDDQNRVRESPSVARRVLRWVGL